MRDHLTSCCFICMLFVDVCLCLSMFVRLSLCWPATVSMLLLLFIDICEFVCAH